MRCHRADKNRQILPTATTLTEKELSQHCANVSCEHRNVPPPPPPHAGVGNGKDMPSVLVGPVESDTITLKGDSDPAGCLRSRKPTTSFAACHNQHVMKAASTTQTVIALSSGTSQLYAFVRGTLVVQSSAFDVRSVMQPTVMVQPSAAGVTGFFCVFTTSISTWAACCCRVLPPVEDL